MVEIMQSPELVRRVPTVRVVIRNSDGLLLMLQKDRTSKAANLWEFPGGQIEPGIGTQEERIRTTAVKEVAEETTIPLDPRSLTIAGEFNYSFIAKGKEQRRTVVVVHAEVSGIPPIEVGLLKNAAGESEDKHSAYRWFTREEIEEMTRHEMISGNSNHPNLVFNK